jgi:hypothetical protein
VIPIQKGIGLEALDAVFCTVTGILAIAVMSDAGTWAVICVSLTTIVANGPKYATAPAAKSEPVRVMVMPGLPTAAFWGLIDTRIGVVFGDTIMVNGRKLEAVLSGFRTNTFTGTTLTRYEEAMLAVREVLDTNVVETAVPFQTI